MPEILKIADDNDLFVIEDAAQSVGAQIKGKKVGSFGKAACFSLHPLKNLFAFGDGGIITVQDPELFKKLRHARNHGLVNREQCDFWSINSRLDEIQAAMLRVQLRHLDQQTEARRRLAFRYNSNLKQYVSVPEENNDEYCVYQTYMIQAEHRNDLKKYLNEHGVEALIHYPVPIHLQPAARYLGYSAEDFPVTMQFVNQILSLPLNPGLTFEQQDRVIDLIAQFYKS
jgi:dTDP-4-amino-4,6-dideoxygalactose transaminase